MSSDRFVTHVHGLSQVRHNNHMHRSARSGFLIVPPVLFACPVTRVVKRRAKIASRNAPRQAWLARMRFKQQSKPVIVCASLAVV